MNIFFWADQHWDDDRLELLGRPFDTVGEMNAALVENYNRLVNPDDLVFWVGDVAAKPSGLRFVDKCLGKKVLLRGNYDRPYSDDIFRRYFYDVRAEGEGLVLNTFLHNYCGKTLKDFGWNHEEDIYLVHYPTQGCVDRLNVVAHVHNSWHIQPNMINVGVDCNHFRPVSLKRLDFLYTGIKTFHDDDTFIAYNPINTENRHKLGKVGTSYFKNKAQ